MNFEVDYDELNREKKNYERKMESYAEKRYIDSKNRFLNILAQKDNSCVSMIINVYKKTGKLPKDPYQFSECHLSVPYPLNEEKYLDRLQQELPKGSRGFVSIVDVPAADYFECDAFDRVDYNRNYRVIATQSQYDSLGATVQAQTSLQTIAFIVPEYAKEDFRRNLWRNKASKQS